MLRLSEKEPVSWEFPFCRLHYSSLAAAASAFPSSLPLPLPLSSGASALLVPTDAVEAEPEHRL